ncbi:hypothetical protein BDN71DRAFT_1454466 [Pleurotus eryngii]|uniref:Uncharacterized protein n=1 Tax=Pleurotus eryngii TaxID=5323 RepID=A0A9P6DB40_PLEER|nr:hypothetical protein BDN71DRAFT_1454466 [Pleurotus eryngii]
MRKVQCSEECRSIASQINYEAIAGKEVLGRRGIDVAYLILKVDVRALSRISRDFDKRSRNVGAGASAPTLTLDAIYQLPKLQNSQSSKAPKLPTPSRPEPGEFGTDAQMQTADGGWRLARDFSGE